MLSGMAIPSKGIERCKNGAAAKHIKSIFEDNFEF